MKDFKEKKKENKSQGQNREVGEMGSRCKDTVVEQFETEAFKSGGEVRKKRKSKVLRKEKRKKERANKCEIVKVDVLPDSVEDALDEHNEHTQGKQKDGKSRKRGKRSEKIKNAGENKVSVPHNEVQDGSKEKNGIQFSEQGKSKKARGRKKDHLSSKKEEVVEKGEAEQSEVYEISSGDEDCSRGMKKWITEYHQSRPGLEILQQRIDDFMTAYEAQEEQARKDQEALSAEGGWTVVVHHKGRKKTTDMESGIAVASVAQAAVLEREAKKKSKTKDLGVDFYRFQKREAKMNEIMALQSKFEQDKKRIQQLRAARKFRPY